MRFPFGARNLSLGAAKVCKNIVVFLLPVFCYIYFCLTLFDLARFHGSVIIKNQEIRQFSEIFAQAQSL